MLNAATTSTTNGWCHFREFSENGISWEIAKKDHFSNWSFINYPKEEFGQLMRWIFVQLNEEIAQEANVAPASLDELRLHNCLDLDIEKILYSMRSKLGILQPSAAIKNAA